MTRREEFEIAMLRQLVKDGYSHEASIIMMRRGVNGEYSSTRVNASWWGWQESAKMEFTK